MPHKDSKSTSSLRHFEGTHRLATSSEPKPFQLLLAGTLCCQCTAGSSVSLGQVCCPCHSQRGSGGTCRGPAA